MLNSVASGGFCLVLDALVAFQVEVLCPQCGLMLPGGVLDDAGCHGQWVLGGVKRGGQCGVSIPADNFSSRHKVGCLAGRLLATQ